MCIRDSPHYLLDSASRLEVELPVLNSAVEVNLKVPQKILGKVQEILGHDSKSTVLLIGIAYKHGISDTRETPALQIAEGLLKLGCNVFWTDDAVTTWESAPKYSGQKIDLAIALSSSTLSQLEEVPGHVRILDCTGNYSSLTNVISYFNS